MPSRTIRKKGSKRTYKRKKSSIVRSINVKNQVFAPKLLTRLKYHERASLSLTGGVAQVYSFRVNSLYDPNYTGGGHQPGGYDQLTAIYNKYRVYKCDYILKMISYDTASTVETSIIANNEPTYSQANDTMAETQRGRYTQWNAYNPQTIRGSIYLPALNGKTSAQYKADEDTYGVWNANPNETLSLHIQNVSGQTTTILFDIMLIYHAELFDPKQLAQS